MWLGLTVADWLSKTFARPKKWMSDMKMNSETEKKEATQETAKRELLEVENSANILGN